MRMAPPPTEVEKAEAQITDAGKSNTPAYRLIPSKVAVQQAKELNMELSNSDIPVSSSLYFQFACIVVESLLQDKTVVPQQSFYLMFCLSKAIHR